MKIFRQENLRPSPTDNRLRISFWAEYDKAAAENRQMRMSTVYAGVCSQAFFHNQYLENPSRVAWMLCPPVEYTLYAREALAYGLEKMRDILEMDIEVYGKVNVKLAELQAKIVKMLDDRVQGSIIQRTENKNTSLSISTSDKEVAKAAMAGGMEDLQRRLKELEKRDRGNQPAVVVESEVTDV